MFKYEEWMQQMLDDQRVKIIEQVKLLINNVPHGHPKDPEEVVWLKPAEAKQFLGLTSRNTWKKLRASGQIDYVRVGREFQYSRQSLVAYKMNRSTLKYKIGTGKKNTQLKHK